MNVGRPELLPITGLHEVNNSDNNGVKRGIPGMFCWLLTQTKPRVTHVIKNLQTDL